MEGFYPEFIFILDQKADKKECNWLNPKVIKLIKKGYSPNDWSASIFDFFLIHPLHMQRFDQIIIFLYFPEINTVYKAL